MKNIKSYWNKLNLFLVIMFRDKKSNFVLITIISVCSWNLVETQVKVSKSLVSTKNSVQQQESSKSDVLQGLRSNLTTNHMLLLERHLQGVSIPFHIAEVANRSLVSEECHKDLLSFQQNILHKKTWAMKALDASGSKPVGFMFQNNFWLGSSPVCSTANKPLRLKLLKFIERPMQPDLLEDVAPFNMAYTVVYMKHNSPWQLEIITNIKPILHLGLCLPASCSTNEIQRLMHELIQQKSLFVTQFYDFRSEVLYVKDLKLKDEFFQRKSLKILCGLLIFTSAMMLSAVYLNAKNSTNETNKFVKPSATDTNTKSINKNIKDSSVDEQSNIIKNSIKCFDIRANWQKLFDAKPCISDDIPIINGLRSVSAFGLLALHVMFFMTEKIDNLPFVLSEAESSYLQLVNLLTFLVDVFFTISGFLQTYNFLKNTKRIEEIRHNTFMQNVRKFLKLLFYRYLRLAPLYFVIMAAADLLTAYINDVSVFHIYDRYDQICARTWWRNVLFIQNFFGLKDLCLNWTWSMSCEMQYFLAATILLFTYVKHPKLVKISVPVLLAFSIVWSLYLGTSLKYQFAYESIFFTTDDIYMNSIVRVMPYILGCIAAWYYIEKQRVLNISPAAEKLLWNFVLVFIAATTYSSYWRDLNYFTSILLFMLGHCMISLATCWLIIASATGRDSSWTRILEAPVFQHINRLTYAIYMLNPFIITALLNLNESATHLNPTLLLIHVLGFAILIYLASIVFALCFEMPYCNWCSLMQKRNKAKTA